MSLQPNRAGGRPGFATLSLDYPMSLGVFEKYEDAQKAVDTLSDKEFPVAELPHRRHGPQADRAGHGPADLGPRPPRRAAVRRVARRLRRPHPLALRPAVEHLRAAALRRPLGCALRHRLGRRRLRLHPWPARLLVRDPGRRHPLRGLLRAQVRPAGAADPRRGRPHLDGDAAAPPHHADRLLPSARASDRTEPAPREVQRNLSATCPPSWRIVTGRFLDVHG